MGPQTGSASLSSYFALDLRNLEKIPTQHKINGCIKSIDGSYGNWTDVDGIIGTYEVLLENKEFVTQGAIPVLDGANIDDYIATQGHIPFQLSLRLNSDQLATETGYIVFSNYNTTGDPSRDEKISYQITFEK